MNVMHMLASAGVGGIENLCKDYANYSKNKNIFVVQWGINGQNAETMRNNGHEVIELNLRKRDLFKGLGLLFKIVKQYKIDAIVVHHAAPLMHVYMQMIKCRFNSVKTFAYAHGEAKDMCRHKDAKWLWLRKTVLRYSISRCHGVVAISGAVKKSLMTYLAIPEEKIVVIYNGTDIMRFAKKHQSISTVDPCVKMVYVGRLIEEKGVQTTLEALHNLPKDLKWTFDIVGDGPYRNELARKTRELALEERVSFWGARSDIEEILKMHDVFVHMPLWEEGFGIAVVEAMAAGLLCICLEKGGIPEVITSGYDGILVDSCEGLTDVLREQLVDIHAEETVLIRQKAMEKAKKFSIEQFSAQLDGLISE